MEPLLRIRDVSYSYHTISGETSALSHISFELMPNEFLAVVGPSGCGKSTLLNLICGLLKPEEGHIFINRSVPFQGDSRIGYMLQKDHLLEWRTIYQNAILGLEIRKEKSPEKLIYIEEMLKAYGLDRFRDAYPSQLSGGMRQRAALIRTLALKPELLLLDEPFSALDYQTRLNVSNDIGTILRKEHKPAVLVTHDISEAISMADRILILTSRPATVAKIIPVHFSLKERTPFTSRSAPEFKYYFNLIWKELQFYDPNFQHTEELSSKVSDMKNILSFCPGFFCSWAFCFYGKSLPDVAGLILSFSAALLKLQKLLAEWSGISHCLLILASPSWKHF